MKVRLCELEEDLRPDDLTITLTCSSPECGAAIRKGQKYGIRPGTNLIYCASCSGKPTPVEPPPATDTPQVRTRPSRAFVGLARLAPGQWSLQHDRCVNCGTTDRPHVSKGRCVRCDNAARAQLRPRATGNRSGGRPLAPGQWSRKYERCVECDTTEIPYGGNGHCQRCRDRLRDDRRLPMSARGMVCALCERGDVPHHARGLCQLCWKKGFNAGKRAERTGEHPSQCVCFSCADARRTQNQRPRDLAWGGMPFAEAVG